MKTAIVINYAAMGHGDELLGEKLIGAFIRKMWAREDRPDTILLYNGGVKLAASSSPILDALSGIEEAGVEILSCGTCIDHYKLENHMMVGRSTSMEEIVDIMMTYDKVITV